MKQIAEQFHTGQSGDSTEGRWQQQPGNEGRRLPHTISSRKM